MGHDLCFICQASNDAGYGHLTRSCNFINSIKDRHDVGKISLFVISDSVGLDIYKRYGIKPNFVTSEFDINMSKYEFVFIDCLALDLVFLKSIKSKALKLISLSPIFNNYNLIDYLYTRSIYIDSSCTNQAPKVVRSGLEYSFLGNQPIRHSTARYIENLNNSAFSIGISMGATDPMNMTKIVLEEISKWEQPCLIWIAIGNVYSHDIAALHDIALNDSVHELVFVNTADSFWSVFQNSSILILQGGVTTYEAAYCGIPSINIPKCREHMGLTSSLLNENLTWVLDTEKDGYNNLVPLLASIFNDKDLLIKMHVRMKNLIDSDGPNRVMDCLVN